MELADKDRKVNVGGTDIDLNPNQLTFDDVTLNQFFQESAGWYNYYGQKMADAESYLQWYETQYDEIYADRFRGYKEDGGSDKLAEARAKCDVKVVDAKKKVIAGKRAVKKLQLFLRALDKAHDNALNFGYMLRKEMDKLQARVMSKVDAELERKVDEVVKAAEPPA